MDEVAEWLGAGRLGGELGNKWTKKVDPAVDNPPVAAPKPKPEGDERLKVSRRR